MNIMPKEDSMQIRAGDLSHPAVLQLLAEHLQEMQATSPPESVHALDLSGLKQTDIHFFTLWVTEIPAACGAIKLLGNAEAELKSMRTAASFRHRGYARAMLRHLLHHAAGLGIQRLYLETGTMAYFAPARALYASEGFSFCAPFADYQQDPNSCFMSLKLAAL